MHKAIPVIILSVIILSVLFSSCKITPVEESTTDTNEKIIATIEKSKPVTKGNLITKTNTTDEGNVAVEYYDSVGNLVESYIWDENEVLSHSIITYTPDNNIQKKEEIDADGTSSSVESYNYDTQGNLQSKTLNEFSQGKLIKSTSYNSDGVVIGYSVSEYDKNGHLIKINRYDTNDTLIEYYIYEYNDNGQAIKYSAFDNTDKLIRYTVFEFNDNNLILSEKYFDGNNNLENYYTFTYDNNGNMLTSSKYDAQGNLISQDIMNTPSDS